MWAVDLKVEDEPHFMGKTVIGNQEPLPSHGKHFWKEKIDPKWSQYAWFFELESIDPTQQEVPIFNAIVEFHVFKEFQFGGFMTAMNSDKNDLNYWISNISGKHNM